MLEADRRCRPGVFFFAFARRQKKTGDGKVHVTLSPGPHVWKYFGFASLVAQLIFGSYELMKRNTLTTRDGRAEVLMTIWSFALFAPRAGTQSTGLLNNQHEKEPQVMCAVNALLWPITIFSERARRPSAGLGNPLAFLNTVAVLRRWYGGMAGRQVTQQEQEATIKD